MPYFLAEGKVMVLKAKQGRFAALTREAISLMPFIH